MKFLILLSAAFVATSAQNIPGLSVLDASQLGKQLLPVIGLIEPDLVDSLPLPPSFNVPLDNLPLYTIPDAASFTFVEQISSPLEGQTLGTVDKNGAPVVFGSNYTIVYNIAYRVPFDIPGVTTPQRREIQRGLVRFPLNGNYPSARLRRNQDLSAYYYGVITFNLQEKCAQAAAQLDAGQASYFAGLLYLHAAVPLSQCCGIDHGNNQYRYKMVEIWNEGPETVTYGKIVIYALKTVLGVLKGIALLVPHQAEILAQGQPEIIRIFTLFLTDRDVGALAGRLLSALGKSQIDFACVAGDILISAFVEWANRLMGQLGGTSFQCLATNFLTNVVYRQIPNALCSYGDSLYTCAGEFAKRGGNKVSAPSDPIYVDAVGPPNLVF